MIVGTGQHLRGLDNNERRKAVRTGGEFIHLFAIIPALSFEGQQVRGVMIDGEPWFVAGDSCRCLGLETYNTIHRSLAKLEADEKRLAYRKDHPSLFDGSRAPNMYLISRPGLLKLIQRSNKPAAKRFDRWVRHEVLPSIMDTGKYEVPGAGQEAAGDISTVPEGLTGDLRTIFSQNAAIIVEALRARNNRVGHGPLL